MSGGGGSGGCAACADQPAQARLGVYGSALTPNESEARGRVRLGSPGEETAMRPSIERRSG